MITLLKEFYHRNVFVRTLFAPLAWIYFRRYDQFLPARHVIRKAYRRVFGKFPDLDNPKTLNEKIQWLKLNDRTPLHTQCADKYAVRKYVSDVVGDEYLIPLLLTSKDVSDLCAENFPDEPFIIKTNHDSGGGSVVRDKGEVDWKAIRKNIYKRLVKNYYPSNKEWQYKNISPCIIAEKLLLTSENEMPFDYKIHCFNGRVECVGVDVDRFVNHRRNFYDRDWKLMPFTWSDVGRDGKPLWPNGRSVSRPDCLLQMIEVAERLAKPFCYCRVDLYVVGGELYFGEITFHHGSGREQFFPEEWDLKFGEMVSLPCET